MSEEEYHSVVDLMHMPNGLIFGLPVVMDTDREDIAVGDKVLLTYQGQVRSLGGEPGWGRWVGAASNVCLVWSLYGRLRAWVRRGEHFVGGWVNVG